MTKDDIKKNSELKTAGIKKVNSMSYRTKNTHTITKLKLIWMFISVTDLNPHSYKFFLVGCSFLLQKYSPAQVSNQKIQQNIIMFCSKKKITISPKLQSRVPFKAIYVMFFFVFNLFLIFNTTHLVHICRFKYIFVNDYKEHPQRKL